MSKIIKVENVTFEYQKYDEEATVKALDTINLEIEEGQFVALIGRNGSGKSTLSKLLNGLLVPTEGKVYVNGYDVSNEETLLNVRQSCGMVFQNPDNQLVSSIVEDDVAFGPENLGVDPKEIRERVDSALKAVNMYDYRLKPPHLLSGGQKQRIAVAGVIAMKPKCIIFDEPTAMLDPKGRKDIMRIIHDLHEEGKTIILVTHFMDEAILSDRVVILDRGKILLDGTPKEVFSNAEIIKEASLELPMEIELKTRLKKEGIELPEDVFRSEEIIDYLCQLK
ncbi:MAG: energy-coupling factor transporter ATPase [Clostridia bacterium]|nr:energy-coupling factor transporter ATPase [Clostridia bacterium]